MEIYGVIVVGSIHKYLNAIQWYPSAKIGTLPECRAKNQKPVV